MGSFVISFMEWDSNFFGYKVGESNNFSSLSEISTVAKAQNYKLIYLRINSENDLMIRSLKTQNLFQDNKITFVKKDLISKNANIHISSIRGSNLTEDILNLALISGSSSRYKLDLQFSNKEFERMYEIWIKNSLSGEIADEVFGYFESNKCIGLVTLKYKNTKSHIGLIAVSPSAQGKGVGAELLKAVENASFFKGIDSIYVPTQRINTNACEFYKKNDFHLFEEEVIFHLWTNV